MDCPVEGESGTRAEMPPKAPSPIPGAKCYLVFDTETTGLPPKYASPIDTDAWKCCRIVQIAWVIYDGDGVPLDSPKEYIIKPDNFLVTPESERIHHISHEYAMTVGVPIQTAIEAFIVDMKHASALVAHNIRFDHNVLSAEMHRYGYTTDYKHLQKKTKICTMISGTARGEKWPKLFELYYRYFGEYPTVSHRADADVAQCARIFFHMKANGIIKV